MSMSSTQRISGGAWQARWMAKTWIEWMERGRGWSIHARALKIPPRRVGVRESQCRLTGLTGTLCVAWPPVVSSR